MSVYSHSIQFQRRGYPQVVVITFGDSNPTGNLEIQAHEFGLDKINYVIGGSQLLELGGPNVGGDFLYITQLVPSEDGSFATLYCSNVQPDIGDLALQIGTVADLSGGSFLSMAVMVG